MIRELKEDVQSSTEGDVANIKEYWSEEKKKAA